MNMIENKQGITSISFEREIQAFCPLGRDYYTANIIVDLEPAQYFMDYCETDSFIKSLSGQEKIIEELVADVFDHVKQYKPKFLCVTAEAKSNTHFPVTVEKSM